MRWRKALAVLANRKKIDSAAMFNTQGTLLSRTENFAEKQEHVEAVLRVLDSWPRHVKLLKLRVFGDVFTCVCPGREGVLVAQADQRLFVAVQTACCLVLAFSNVETRGSCVYEVTEFSKLLQQKVCPRVSASVSSVPAASSSSLPATSSSSSSSSFSSSSDEDDDSSVHELSSS